MKWAADQFIKWYGDQLPKEKTYGELLYAISKMNKESEPSLNELLYAKGFPSIIRTSAVEQNAVFSTKRIAEQVQNNLQSNDPFLRLNALKAIANFPAETIISSVDALLNDPVSSVRFEAMLRLSPFLQQLPEERKVI